MKCKENQILDPEINKCINKDTKKATEILLNIHKLYELFDGKIVKRCEKV